MDDQLDLYHPDVVEAFAAAWASIDGKLEAFEREKHMPMPAADEMERSGYTGHYEGYMAEADELLRRAAKRLPEGVDLWRILTPLPPA